MPAHCRMRAYDRDLIRGGHYGQRPRVPHKQAEHMAAPTNAANVKKVLANSEPSTHGTKRTLSSSPKRKPRPLPQQSAAPDQFHQGREVLSAPDKAGVILLTI